MRLAGKNAIVTGAGRGIGRAIAEAFAREGAHVVVADLDAAAARSVAEAIVAAGGRASGREVDVSQREQMAALVRETAGDLGKLDIMINNAGVPGGPWQQTIAVNLTGVSYGIRYAAESMAASGGGSIVSAASVGGLVGLGGPPNSGTDAYVASKHGVIGLTKEYALEYGHRNVRVNCVCPGPTETEMIRYLLEDSEWHQRMIDSTALKRIARPEEIANAYLFLASDESSFITGTALVVDGGQTAI